MAHPIDILTSLAKQTAEVLEFKSKHHFVYNSDRGCECKTCEYADSVNEWGPYCEWFLSDESGVWKDPDGTGENMTVAYDNLALIFKQYGFYKDFNVLFCDKYKPKNINYMEYIQSEDWKKRRDKKLRKADWKCERCGSGINLCIHHITYDNLGNEPMSDLLVLCKSCHEDIHRKDLEIKEATEY